MTLDADLTRQVREWLRDGVTEVPDRVLNAVLVELPANPQHRTPRPRHAWGSMSVVTPLRVATAAAIVVLGIAGLGLAGASPSGPGGRSGATNASPRPSPGLSPRPASPPSTASTPSPVNPEPTTGIGPAFATSLVPGARTGELTLVPHPSSQQWLTFIAGQPIDGHLRTDEALSTPGVPIVLRLYRSDPAEGLIVTWASGHRVDAEQTDLDFRIDGQEPGRYRLVAYHAMTEPLAVLDLTVEGNPSAPPARPSVPPDWHAERSMSGDLELWLPADFGVVSDRSSLIANPPPNGATAWVSVMAESPAGVDVPPAPGASLAEWLDERWFAADTGDWSRGVASSIRLPAGEAVQLVRHLPLERGSVTAILYAIRTPDGVGFLVIDGPMDQISERSEELDLIAQLVSYP